MRKGLAADRPTQNQRIHNMTQFSFPAGLPSFGVPKGVIVRNNTLMGDWDTMAIGGAGICTFAAVMDNVIYNAATTVNGCINFAATATGVCVRNLCAGGAAQANGVTATAFVIAENYYGVLAEDTSAILDPVIT